MQEGDELTRTDCYHYLHVICFARYLNFYERQQQELIHTLALPTMDHMEPSSVGDMLHRYHVNHVRISVWLCSWSAQCVVNL